MKACLGLAVFVAAVTFVAAQGQGASQSSQQGEGAAARGNPLLSMMARRGAMGQGSSGNAFSMLSGRPSMGGMSGLGGIMGGMGGMGSLAMLGGMDMNQIMEMMLCRQMNMPAFLCMSMMY